MNFITLTKTTGQVARINMDHVSLYFINNMGETVVVHQDRSTLIVIDTVDDIDKKIQYLLDQRYKLEK
jgi:hypothetical protein